MSQALRLWTIVMLGAGGLFTGGTVGYAWERVWIWRQLTLPEYAVDFRRSLRKADPAMPILVVICGAAASTFASLTDGAARALAYAGIGLLAVILVSSILLAEPVNSQFRRRPEGDVPPDAEHLLWLWRRFHLVRTGPGGRHAGLPRHRRHLRLRTGYSDLAPKCFGTVSSTPPGGAGSRMPDSGWAQRRGVGQADTGAEHSSGGQYSSY